MKNISKVLLALGFWLVCFTPALADNITTDTEWTLANSPYTATSSPNFYILPGVTLTIDPGVVVESPIGTNGGNIIASGTAALPITLNSTITINTGTTSSNGLPISTTTLSHVTVNGSLYAYITALNISDVQFNGSYSSDPHNATCPLTVEASSFVHASTSISGSNYNGFCMVLGDLLPDQVWSADNNMPYIVGDGDTLYTHLTLASGTVVKVAKLLNYSSPMVVANGGLLDVQGTTTAPVYFTSIQDDSVGGDTNGDGSATTSARGNWGGISVNGGSANINNAIISYAGTGLAYTSYTGTSLSGSYIKIASSTVGVWVLGTFSTSTLNNLELTGNGTGAYVCGPLTVTNSAIVGNDKGTDTNNCSSGSSADFRNNWWGSVSGPYNATINPTGTGDSVINNGTLYSPWLTSDPRNPAPACLSNCNSNVMFLPGIEASNLFVSTSTEKQLWLPDNRSYDVPNLDLTNSSVANAVYTKEGSMVDVAYSLPIVGGYNVYASFINQMNTLASSSVIAAWEPIAYDWRLDYQTLLNNGNKTSDGKIYYRGTNAATSTPYIIQELKKLAANSRTGKVTIVAHSNGGLLAKALLMQPGIAQYVDKVILVATPQLGTPQAIASLLHGSQEGLPLEIYQKYLTASDARYLGQSMPMAYNLLPTSQYFNYTLNPAITFDPVTLGWMATKYGSFIAATSTLRNFITDSTRPIPAYDDLMTPDVVSSTLFDNANSVHTSIDNWTPPTGIQFITIAGWGDPTLVTLEYKKIPQYSFGGMFLATTTGAVMAIDGDGTVVDSSAAWGNGATTTRYWVNLKSYNQDNPIQTYFGWLPLSHANIFEVPQVRTLVSNIISQATSTLPQYVSIARPVYLGTDPRVYYIAHSPVTLGFTDSSGNYTGSTATTTVFNAPGVDYQRFGEVQWLSVPASTTGQVVMHGTASGSFALDVQSVNGNTYLATTTFAAVPIATSTVATIAVSPTTSPTASSTLLVDEDGNGTTDITMHAVQNSVVLPATSTPPATVALVSTSTATYVVHYENLPANSVLAFANSSHTVVGGYRTPIAAGGSGTTTIVAYGLASGYASVMALATTTATTSLAESTQFYVSGTVSPSLTYVSGDVTGQTVTVTYNRIPSNNELVFVNTTSGAVVSGHATTVTAGSAGTTTISVAGITPYGQYYLRARDATTHTTPTYAQTVNFYISDPNGGDGL